MSFKRTAAILPEHPGRKTTNGNNHPYYPTGKEKEKSVAKRIMPTKPVPHRTAYTTTYWKLSFVIIFAFEANHANRMMKPKIAMYTRVPFLTGYESVDISC